MRTMKSYPKNGNWAVLINAHGDAGFADDQPEQGFRSLKSAKQFAETIVLALGEYISIENHSNTVAYFADGQGWSKTKPTNE